MNTLAELKRDFFEKKRLYDEGASPAEGGVTYDDLWNHPWHAAMRQTEMAASKRAIIEAKLSKPKRPPEGREEGEMELQHFIGRDQLSVMLASCRGEEGKYFRNKIVALKTQIEAMPKSYETDGQGDEATAILHYFNGGSDWYITEKDTGSPDDEEPGVQAQAFGFTCLNGDAQNAEMGYIGIRELIRHGVEIDLYYTPQTIGAIKARFGKRAA